MAKLCDSCHRIHPKNAKEVIKQNVQEMKMRMIAHKEVCDCTDPEGHIRKRDRANNRRPQIYGFHTHLIGFTSQGVQ